MRTTLTIKLACFCGLIGLTLGSNPTIDATQLNTTRTIRDGVFTTAQASLGQELFEANCARCHGEDLLGANARPLAGDAFIRDWGGLTLDQFYERVRNMPPGAPSSLADTDYLHIITYVLQVNEFPPGVEELALHALSDINVEGEGGPGEVPDFLWYKWSVVSHKHQKVIGYSQTQVVQYGHVIRVLHLATVSWKQ